MNRHNILLIRTKSDENLLYPRNYFAEKRQRTEILRNDNFKRSTQQTTTFLMCISKQTFCSITVVRWLRKRSLTLFTNNYTLRARACVCVCVRTLFVLRIQNKNDRVVGSWVNPYFWRRSKTRLYSSLSRAEIAANRAPKTRRARSCLHFEFVLCLDHRTHIPHFLDESIVPPLGGCSSNAAYLALASPSPSVGGRPPDERERHAISPVRCIWSAGTRRGRVRADVCVCAPRRCPTTSRPISFGRAPQPPPRARCQHGARRNRRGDGATGSDV